MERDRQLGEAENGAWVIEFLRSPLSRSGRRVRKDKEDKKKRDRESSSSDSDSGSDSDSSSDRKKKKEKKKKVALGLPCSTTQLMPLRSRSSQA